MPVPGMFLTSIFPFVRVQCVLQLTILNRFRRVFWTLMCLLHKIFRNIRDKCSRGIRILCPVFLLLPSHYYGLRILQFTSFRIFNGVINQVINICSSLKGSALMIGKSLSALNFRIRFFFFKLCSKIFKIFSIKSFRFTFPVPGYLTFLQVLIATVNH